MLRTILIVILILLLIGALPTWPYSSGWGYYPGGGIGLILVIVLILVLVGLIWRRSRTKIARGKAAQDNGSVLERLPPLLRHGNVQRLRKHTEINRQPSRRS
jgi:Protein of unknown function (DUF3309)